MATRFVVEFFPFVSSVIARSRSCASSSGFIRSFAHSRPSSQPGVGTASLFSCPCSRNIPPQRGQVGTEVSPTGFISRTTSASRGQFIRFLQQQVRCYILYKLGDMCDV